jgi:PEP-CTERM motif
MSLRHQLAGLGLGTAIAALMVSAASASVMSLYGTINCFGLPGVTSCPDTSLWETGLGGVFFTDYRNAYDLANAPATDIWTAPGNVSWTQPTYSPAGATSASLSIRIAGIADVNTDGGGGNYPVLFDGTNIGIIPDNTNANAFQEVLTYTYSVPVALLTGTDTVELETSTGDGFIIDYSQLTINTSVPEPASIGLLLVGLASVGGVLIRRSQNKSAARSA